MGRKTPQDPTGQAANRNRGTKRLIKRLNNAQRKVKALFRAVPRDRRTMVKLVNESKRTVIYEYEFNQQDFERSLVFIINDELLETQTSLIPFQWYWKEDIERPYRQGTAEEIRDFNQLISRIDIQPIPVEQVLLGEPYRTRLNDVYVSNFSNIKTLSERTSSQVMQRIIAGVEAGEPPSVITEDIIDRFDVARSSAQRISETEVNKAYNNAKLDATEQMEQQTGLRAGVIHISALAPTTRESHADRHGNAYTVPDQLQWWNTGVNRINCKCTTRSVLIDKQGNVVNVDIQQKIKAQKA